MINRIIHFMGIVLHVLMPYSRVILLKRLRRRLNSAWRSPEFKYVGKNISIGTGLDLRGAKYIRIGNNVSIGDRVTLTAWDEYIGAKFDPQVEIGDNVSIGDDAHITVINKLTIESGVMIGKKVTVTDNSHGLTNIASEKCPAERPLVSKAEIYIHQNVWIGDKVTILPGVILGKGAVIGANSVVSRSIPANSIAGGVPAKVIKAMTMDCIR